MKNLLVTAATLALSLGYASSAHAFGSKPVTPTQPSQPSQPAPPVSQQAKPYRYVELSQVTVPLFYLPNGSRADYNLDLNTLINSQVNASRYFRTTAANPAKPNRLVISGGITSFEANVSGTSLKIGWNKAGVILPGQTVSGEVTLKLTALSMDFLVYDRVQQATRLSATTDQTLSNLNLSVTVNLANLNGSLTSFYQDVLAKAVEKATADVMKRLEDRSDFDSVFWDTDVVGLDVNQNIVGLGVGSAQNVRVGDVYSIYSACTDAEIAANQCFSRFLADVRVSQVGQNSAQAQPYSSADSLSHVQVGDRLEVKLLTSTQ